MVQSPSWAANWFAASQEIPRILWNPKVHYRTHKRPPPVSILGPPNPVHIPTSYLLEIRPNIIHPSTPRSPQWCLSLRLPHQDPIHPLSSPIRTTCPAHLILQPSSITDVHSSLSTAFCRHLLTFVSRKSFSTSSVHLNLGLPLLLLLFGLFSYIFLTPSLIHSYYMSNPFQSLLFNACYYVQIFIYAPQMCRTLLENVFTERFSYSYIHLKTFKWISCQNMYLISSPAIV